MTPQKHPPNLHTQKIIPFPENPKNIENQNFKPPKNGPSLSIYENIRVILPWGGAIEWSVLLGVFACLNLVPDY